MLHAAFARSRTPRHRGVTPLRTPRRAALATTAIITMLAGLFIGAPAATADDLGSGVLSLAKSVEVTAAQQPGDTFIYSIGFGCSSTTTGCVDAVLTDSVPAPLEVVGTPNVVGVGSYDTTVSGNDIVVSFSDAVANTTPPSTGLSDSTTGTVQVTVRVPNGLEKSWDGQSVTNSAQITAVNADTKQDDVTVQLTVPTEVRASVDKAWAPAAAPYLAGTASTVTISVGNDSNIDATSITVLEPSDPDSADSFFAHYDLTGVTSATFPQGADRVQVDARVSGVWENGTPAATAVLPASANATPEDVDALRVTFTSSSGTTITANGTDGSLVLAVAQRANHRVTSASLSAGGVRVNNVSATVSTPDGDDAASANAEQEIAPLTASVTVEKVFDVAEIPAGETVTATLTATNTSTGPLTSLTIQEPMAPNAFFSDAILFAGFDVTGAQWPAGATSAEVSWTVSGGTVPPAVTATDFAGLPTNAPTVDAGEHITGFVITFTGEIEVGATAEFGVTVDTTAAAAALPGQPSRYENAVRASGVNQAGTGTAEDSADLLVWEPSIQLGLTKTIRPADVYVGGYSLVELEASTPGGTSTVRPHEIVVTEPAAIGASPYWNAFTPIAIGATSVPLGSVMTVEYHDGIGWNSMDGSSGVVTGPQVFASNLSDLLPSGVTVNDVLGLRFTYTDSDGFGRATTVKPAIVFQARGELRGTSDPTATGTYPDESSWASYENCAGATAEAPVPPLTDSDADCATARIIPTDGGPGPGIAAKSWDDLTLAAQSRADTGVTLTWGVQTGGFETVVVSDVPNPTVAGIPNTVFQAFDLARIDTITPSRDPLMRWDSVTKVELYNQVTASWDDITSDACPTAAACTGTFAGYDLTPTERANTIGVQLTFSERGDRASVVATSPLAPPVGSGVASAPSGSYGGASANGRTIHLDLQLRSVLRVPDAQDYVTATRQYNELDPGVVRNDLGVVASPFTGTDVSTSASDRITLLQSAPTVEATKTVSPVAVTIPRPDVPQASYPHLVYTTTVQNTTPSNVTALRLTDPSVCADPADPVTCSFSVGDLPFATAAYDASVNPFERVNLAGIDLSTSSASGVTSQVVHLWHRDASGVLTTSGPYTGTAAEALGDAALADVIGISVLFEGADSNGGTIVTGATGTVALDVQLRRTLRSTGAIVTPSTVPNTVLVGVHDGVLYPTLFNQDAAAANATLNAGYVEVVTDKLITPGSTNIASPASPVRVDLRARSTGTVSPKSLTIEDAAETFWNAFTLSSLSVPTMPSGANRVEIFALASGSWVSDGPTTAALAALPASVDPDDITGVRAVFTNSSGGIFVGTNNAVNLRLLVELRDQLRDGSGPVTADGTVAPMPGETLPGRVTNTVAATIVHDELSDVATDTEVFRILTGTATMAVEKTSVGQSAAGKDVPFTLRMRNTGTGYLVNPVVVDQLPADGSLLYVPTDVPVYSTTAGGALSVDPTQVTRSYDAASGRISFTWPNGALLAPGETYSITLRLQVKPGLTAGSIALNGMQASNDRQVTACTAINPGNGRSVTLAGNTCATDNVVTILSIGSFSASKGVRSELATASNTLNPALTCTPDADGYYRYPCAANTMIGDVDEWRLQLTNGGTIGATTLQFVDVFPHPGDRGVVDPSPRGSGYVPTFRGDVSFTSTASGVGFDWFYTTNEIVCTDDLFPGGPACSPSDWLPSASLTPTTAPDVTAIKAVFDFAALPGGVLPPASTLGVTYSTINEPSTSPTDQRAPVTVPVADVRAWNSFGYYPTYSAGANPPSPEEPIKAGVLLTSGSLEVTKVVTGSQADRAPDSFGANVECTVGGAPVIMGAFGQMQLDAADGLTARLDGLPAGSQCTVSETGILGWYGESSRSAAQTVTIAALAADQPVGADQAIEIVNVYEPKLLPVTGPQAIATILMLAFGMVGIGLLLKARRRRA